MRLLQLVALVVLFTVLGLEYGAIRHFAGMGAMCLGVVVALHTFQRWRRT